MDRDDRDADHRPLASDVLLSFWKYVAQQPVRSLRGIMFQTVEEPGTQHVKRRVYTNLDKRSSRAVSLSCRSQGAKKAEFDRVHDYTKLGRCVRTIATEYVEMKDARAAITEFEFVPQDPRGNLFHLVVTLGYR